MLAIGTSGSGAKIISVISKDKSVRQRASPSMQGRDHSQVITLKGKLHALLAKNERLWRQQSRVKWLKNGDRNTRYFHCKATQQKRRNHVYRLKDQAGVWTSLLDQVPPLFIEYYNSLFNTANPS